MNFIISIIANLISVPIHIVGIIATSLAALVFKTSSDRTGKPRLIWGPDPILHIRYWSNALKNAGYASVTLMECFYSISSQQDFDLYTSDLIPSTEIKLLKPAIRALKNYTAFIHALKNADIVHLPLTGFYLRNTPFWRLEACLLKLAGKKSVCTPYGSDILMYSRIHNPSLKFALNANYPSFAQNEFLIQKRVSYWSRHADVMLTSIFFDGVGRCDVNAVSPCTIDTALWSPRTKYSQADGTNGTVYILHAPNHRYLKGTEYVLASIDALKAQGLKVELILAEKMPNEKIRELLQEKVDILAEQFVFCSYALSAIEAMAAGVAVVTNLEEEHYTRGMRRYSYLDECPVLSADIENLTTRLKALVVNPALREELGKASRKYVEKYHSDKAALYLFESIYKKIWHNQEINLLDLFHPLKSSYILDSAKITHPLFENRIKS